MSFTKKKGFGFRYTIVKYLASTFTFYLTVSLLFIALSPLKAQSEVQGSTSLSFQNEKLSNVLTKLSEVRDLNFSYDANDPIYESKINYSSVGQSTERILNDILSAAGLTYNKIGNQIVLYKTKKTDELIINTETIVNPESNDSDSEIPDEEVISGVIFEYKLDTVFLTDTIFRVDTIRMIDTVFIEAKKPGKNVQAKIKKIPVDFFQPGIERDKGWAMGAFIAPVLDDFSLVDGQKSFSLRSFSLGMTASKLLNRWNISLGLQLTQFNQRFDQLYTDSEGGFYDMDTIDIYYTVSETDTSWYYVTDSAWVPLQTQEYSYQQTNTLGYLEVNFSASYDLYQSQKVRFYVKAGGQLSFLIYNNGIAISNKNDGLGIDFNQLQFNTVNYAFVLGTGFKYKLTEKVDFYSQLFYTRYLNQLVPDFPTNTNINAIGLKVGLIFYL